MKLLFILALIIPLAACSQDSTKVTVDNVVIKAKDLWYIYTNLPRNNRNEKLDSIIKAKARPNTPSDNSDVTVSGIERRVWREVYSSLLTDPVAYFGNVQKRVHDAILLINDVWLNDKVPKDESPINDVYNARVDSGKKLAKKEAD